MAKVISGFPGIGKTWLGQNKLNCIDLDSSRWKDHDEYMFIIERIWLNLSDDSYLLVSSHIDVRERLIERGIAFYFVLPEPDLGEEYRRRYVSRGTPQSLVDLIMDNWESWTEDPLDDALQRVVRLGSGSHLLDILDDLV